jgi:hypothetical protein
MLTKIMSAKTPRRQRPSTLQRQIFSTLQRQPPSTLHRRSPAPFRVSPQHSVATGPSTLPRQPPALCSVSPQHPAASGLQHSAPSGPQHAAASVRQPRQPQSTRHRQCPGTLQRGTRIRPAARRPVLSPRRTTPPCRSLHRRRRRQTESRGSPSATNPERPYSARSHGDCPGSGGADC